MAAASTPSVATNAPLIQQPASMPYDITQPPVIEGFTPTSRRDDETFKERFMVKFKQNPFVPIGNTRDSQWLMRGRIFAQGFTVAALIFGVFATSMKSKD
ncbi:hypothetical protein CRUP_007961 [Coryphaenoides rupestris]|nr:hypothetical protein CRUP_007961 [Coryphaenoides rupestris]